MSDQAWYDALGDWAEQRTRWLWRLLCVWDDDRNAATHWASSWLQHGLTVTFLVAGGIGAALGYLAGQWLPTHALTSTLAGGAIGSTLAAWWYRRREAARGTLGTRDGQLDWRAPAVYAVVWWLALAMGVIWLT